MTEPTPQSPIPSPLPVPAPEDSFGHMMSDENIETGVDLVQEMIDANPPPDIDYDSAKTMTFLDDNETCSKGGHIVIYDDGLHGKRFDPEDLPSLIKSREMPGVGISGEVVVELIKIALDSYMHNRMGATDEERNRLAQRIHEIMEPLNLI